MEPVKSTFDERIANVCDEFATNLRLQFPELRGVMIGLAYQPKINNPNLVRNIFSIGDGQSINPQDAMTAVDIANVMLNSSATLYAKTITEMIEQSKLVLLQLRNAVQEAQRGPSDQQTTPEQLNDHQAKEEAGQGELSPARTQGEAQQVPPANGN